MLLGETGAGKSLIIDSINFVLGAKADRSQIRSGEEIMKVSGFFSANEKSASVLEKFGFEKSDEILISRSYSIQGKSEIRINGEYATASMLKELGQTLVDSFNQNEQVELAKSKNHIVIVDSFKPDLIDKSKSELEEKISKIRLIDKDIAELGGDEKSRATKIDILKYQISEIEELNLKNNEIEEIGSKLEQISNSEKILNSLGDLKSALSNDEFSVISSLKNSISQISNLVSYDNEINELYSKMQNICYDLEDIDLELENLFEKYNFDEHNIDFLIDRRDKIENIQSKYGTSFDEIMAFLNNAKDELEKLENADEMLSSLNLKRNNLKLEIYNICKSISNERRNSAKELTSLLESGLREVGIKSGKINIVFADNPNFEDFNSFSANGFDSVEIMFSANLGEELKSLSKTISGGEMSRFMLVLKNILADKFGTETIIFDEIDSGISGEIASQVAKKIANLSKKYQIICITHLPQVASCGDNFIKVYKTTHNDRTETQINILSEEETLKQIALMASGSVTESSLNYAKELRKK